VSTTPQLSASSFAAIRELIFAVAGISKTEEKEELVKSRLAARLRELKIAGYEEYLDRIQSDRVELSNMVDVLTTNKTSFFREQQHFDYLLEHILPAWRAERRPRRIWSAGCSSGEEPYTLGMLLFGRVWHAQRAACGGTREVLPLEKIARAACAAVAQWARAVSRRRRAARTF
jgi:chemotaxis methyl-accepting protein methylase